MRRSRELILAAAEKYFSDYDTPLTMSELAHLAGVGNATLYRRYSSIDEVIRELYGRLLGALQSVADDVLAQPSAWDGIVALVIGIANTLQDHPAIPRLNRRMVEIDDGHRFASQWDDALDQLVAGAQAEGKLRPDVNSNDITFAAFRVGSYANLPPSERDRVIGRQIGIILDGIRVDGVRSTLPGSPISSAEVHEIFRYEVAHPLRPPTE